MLFIIEIKKHHLVYHEVRDIIEEVNKKPYEGDKKVIIIYNAIRLTSSGSKCIA